MPQYSQSQWTTTKAIGGSPGKSSNDSHLAVWIEQFLIDRKVQNLSRGTLYFYQKKLQLFTEFCEGRSVSNVTQLTADDLRRYLLHLEETGHNIGGQHAALRAVKTFLLWFEAECQPDQWANPIRRVKLPKLPTEPLEPISPDVFERLTRACGSDFYGRRDLALISTLMDTGVRASEALAVNLDDVDQVSGAILIRQGKGKKPRTVYLGKKVRRNLRAYLKLRDDNSPALWLSGRGERLTYWGLRGTLRRLSERAGVPVQTAHSFRRGFALACLRDGMNIYALQALMGHADLQVLRRYLKQVESDLRDAHAAHSPVDNLGEKGGGGSK